MFALRLLLSLTSVIRFFARHQHRHIDSTQVEQAPYIGVDDAKETGEETNLDVCQE